MDGESNLKGECSNEMSYSRCSQLRFHYGKTQEAASCTARRIQIEQMSSQKRFWLTPGQKSFALLLIALSTIIASAAALKFSEHRSAKVEGKIDEPFYLAIKDLVATDIDQLKISSSGGSFFWALKAARLLQENNVDLVVEGECLSACASVLMAAKKQVQAAPGALIAFHRPIGAWVEINEYVERTSGRTLQDVAQFKTALEVQQLYRDSGVDPTVSIAALFKQGIECIDTGSINPPFRLNEVELWLRDDFYVPSKAMLSQFGWNLSGYPEGDALLAMGKVLAKKYPEYSYRVENPGFRFDDHMLESGFRIASIADCDKPSE
ncbi:MAG: hypothetical protein HRT64_01700 [Erythrobacter sp.]|nr:hypothetical protein [Erythrobacter sp.]